MARDTRAIGIKQGKARPEKEVAPGKCTITRSQEQHLAGKRGGRASQPASPPVYDTRPIAEEEEIEERRRRHLV